MTLQLWISSKQAKEYGCTHHARLFGIIPGFCADGDRLHSNLWVPRSDLLYPIEVLLTTIWMAMRFMRDEEPDFMIDVLGEIK